MSSLNKASSDEEYDKLLEKAQKQWKDLTPDERDYACVGIDYLSEKSAKKNNTSVKDTLKKATDNNIAALNEINSGVDNATKISKNLLMKRVLQKQN